MWHQLREPADPGDVARVLAALAAAEPRCGTCRVVAIDGPSGSGKTTLAAALAHRLNAPVAHMDEIFPGWSGLAAAVDLVTDQVLAPISRGEQAAYRTWDWDANTWNGTVTLPPAELLIVEGCGASVGPAGACAAVRVWVDAPATLRRARAIERDGEDFAPHWDDWAAQEEALFGADRTRERADIVIDTSRWREP